MRVSPYQNKVQTPESLPGASFTMSPHRIPVLPSRDALHQYGISQNGFLPAEPPLRRLSHDYYQPWESIVERLPVLIEKQQIREWVDELPVLETSHLSSEAEWQRAHSLLAVIAQGYIWTGPEPSQVGYKTQSAVFIDADKSHSDCLLQSLYLSSRLLSVSRSTRWPHTQH